MSRQSEPVVIAGVVVAVLTTVEQLALPLPQWARTVIAVALVVAGAVQARGRVTPNVRVRSRVRPVTRNVSATRIINARSSRHEGV